ncbi:CYTH domain-containing protein (plasmid) [Salipiger sp. H15]|uniref:CYTH domain-containing protein n=1 Tax=Alloyangia sp. H15 TaxID=3029062 RepID=A0AAU8AS26_9RHOB
MIFPPAFGQIVGIDNAGMPMAREIERKFLVASDDWRAHVSHRVELRDGILALHEGRKVRVRFYGEERVTLCVKGPRSGMSRDEFEYPIPREDGLVLIEHHCDGPPIRKTRHHLRHDGRSWTIDEYHGPLAGTLIAEIELPSEDAAFARPPWLGVEVTHDRDYRQTALLRRHRSALADSA